MIKLDIIPIPKPRMTQSDRWKKRDCVERYFVFKDELKRQWKDRELIQPCHIIFYLPIPNSWSKKKQEKYHLQPHQQRPDIDNLLKAFQDALFEEDGHIYDVRATKLWSKKPAIIIKDLS